MGNYDVDFDDYEGDKSGGYSGPEPTRGIFDGKLVSLQDHTAAGSGQEGFRWIFEITEGDYAGWRGYQYSNMESTKWKTQQIVKAISGGKEEPLKINTTKDGTDSKTVKKAKPVRLQLKMESYDDEKVAKLNNVLPVENVGGEKAGKKKKKGDDPF